MVLLIVSSGEQAGSDEAGAGGGLQGYACPLLKGDRRPGGGGPWRAFFRSDSWMNIQQVLFLQSEIQVAFVLADHDVVAMVLFQAR